MPCGFFNGEAACHRGKQHAPSGFRSINYLHFKSATEQTELPKLVLFLPMATVRKPDPELLPIGRPRCPKCAMRMLTANVQPGPEGFEHRTFECLRCGHSDKKVIACDPLKSGAVGWLAGELGRPL
jgi:hypothetical protein